MFNNLSTRTRTLLIASLILNLAFISGFALKKFGSSRKPVNPTTCQMNTKGVGYMHLCQGNPGFKHTFHNYQKEYHAAFLSLKKAKLAFLQELQQEKAEPQTLEKWLQEINQKTLELNEKNYRHLITLRGVLKPADFARLVECMAHMLGSSPDMPFPEGKGNCMEQDK